MSAGLSPAFSIASSSTGACRRALEASRHQRLAGGNARRPRRRVAVARLELIAYLARVFLDLLALGHEQLHAARGAEKLDDRNRFAVFVEAFAHGHHEDLVRRPRRTLR